MSPEDLALMWLRDQAHALRDKAAHCEQAYRTGSPLAATCERVARAYRRAAVALDDEATAIEDEAKKVSQ